MLRRVFQTYAEMDPTTAALEKEHEAVRDKPLVVCAVVGVGCWWWWWLCCYGGGGGVVHRDTPLIVCVETCFPADHQSEIRG